MDESSSADTDNEASNKRRRGIRNPDSYKSQKIKKAKVKGIEHVNHAGKKVEARKTGQNCSCRKQCFQKFDEECKGKILYKFNSFEEKNDQDIYLQGLILACEIKRRRQRKDDGNPRSNSFYYFVEILGKKTSVCKKAFVALHGVTDMRVRRLCTLLQTGKAPVDRRGKQPTANAVPGVELDRIRTHIEAFPVKVSHYASKTIKYLDSRLDVKTMYELFKKKYPDSKVKYKFYLKYFHDNFDLRFGRPQVDTCSTCEELKTKLKNKDLNDTAKRAATAELMVHNRRSKKFYSAIRQVEKECQDREDTLGICFDYMQNLPLPHIPVQEVFYYRQLWVNVFCIHNLKNKQAHLFLYHEGIAKKGPNEICSMLHYYIQNHVAPNIRKLYVFSDACPGQNRNQTLMRFWTTIAGSGRFQLINHRYPTRGHSFLPCDRDFGTVKRVVKKADRVYVPEQYLQMATKSSTKFNVMMVNEDFPILNFKGWWPRYFKRNTLSVESLGRNVPREQKRALTISQYFEVVYSSSEVGRVKCSEFIGGLQQQTFSLLATGQTGVPDLPTETAFSSSQKNPINSKKLEDVKKLERYIPKEFMGFYSEIFEWPTTNVDEQEQE